MNFKTVERLVVANGWKLVRVCGSHYQYKKSDIPFTVVIPNHGTKDISIGVLKNLENQKSFQIHLIFLKLNWYQHNSNQKEQIQE